jgi:hypothetical protein
MASLILPEDVAEHLAAAIQLYDRRWRLRLLDEAQTLINLNLSTAAIVVAGIVMESMFQDASEAPPQHQQQIAKWRDMRNRVVHQSTTEVTREQAQEMVEGVGWLLSLRFQATAPISRRPATTPQQIRGKYRFVPTSSEEFIKRKADELRLEHE